jgi:uncharacterized protein (TIGR00255 family)
LIRYFYRLLSIGREKIGRNYILYMLISMTGFGQGESSSNGYTVSAEIRSVNNRFLDLSLKMAPGLRQLENPIRDLIQRNVDRGKLTAQINLVRHNNDNEPPKVDADAAKVRIAQLRQLAELAGIDEPIQMNHLLGFQELFMSSEDDPDTLALLQDLCSKAVTLALKQLNSMRLQEGNFLTQDISKRIDQLESLMVGIQSQAISRVPEAREKMHERIKNLLGDENFDKSRLELEIAILADRLDVSEEIVRMEGHIRFFREALAAPQSMGRRLNFLSQEMNREVNTIGSKCNHAGISHNVVELKEILEQIREQIQNIE